MRLTRRWRDGQKPTISFELFPPRTPKAALNAFGVDFALRQCRELIKAGVAGLHIYTMDRSKSAVPLVQALRTEGIL